MTTADLPFSVVFARALQGHPCAVLGLDEQPRVLPMDTWVREPDADDLALVALCEGSTIDIGCGPGRLTTALAYGGHVALGIDIVHEAVGQTRERGAAAMLRDVYDELPGEGRWHTALLADGNIGIGGDPVALLTRVRELIDPRGCIVVEVEGPGVQTRSAWASLECGGSTSRPFCWSVVGIDGIDAIARDAGFVVSATHRFGQRWAAVLNEGIP